jgi:hypothetical protein
VCASPKSILSLMFFCLGNRKIDPRCFGVRLNYWSTPKTTPRFAERWDAVSKAFARFDRNWGGALMVAGHPVPTVLNPQALIGWDDFPGPFCIRFARMGFARPSPTERVLGLQNRTVPRLSGPKVTRLEWTVRGPDS